MIHETTWGVKPDPTGAVGALPALRTWEQRQGNSGEAGTRRERTWTGPGTRPPWLCGGHRPQPREEAARDNTHACAHTCTRGTRRSGETWCQLSTASLSFVFPSRGRVQECGV